MSMQWVGDHLGQRMCVRCLLVAHLLEFRIRLGAPPGLQGAPPAAGNPAHTDEAVCHFSKLCVAQGVSRSVHIAPHAVI